MNTEKAHGSSAKSSKKKIIITVCLSALAVVVLTCALLILFPPLSVDYGKSLTHTRSDITNAFYAVKSHFAKNMFGSTMLSASYSGDDRSKVELLTEKRCNDSDEAYVDCVVLNVDFRTSIFQSDFFSPGTDVSWSYIVVKTDGGVWRVVDYGCP